MTGRTALVTGAGHRLGAAIARSLSRRGYSVWVHYHRSHEAAQVLAAELRNKGGVVRTIQADLAAPGFTWKDKGLVLITSSRAGQKSLLEGWRPTLPR